MLILSRTQAQSILIGAGVRITVVGIDRGRIRIGIEAPSEIPVLRGELPSLDASEPRSSEAGDEVNSRPSAE